MATENAQAQPKWRTQFSPGWEQEIGKEMDQPYFKNILNWLHQEKMNGKIIYPRPAHIFNAFYFCPFETIKVVILGQDPYHGAGQAHGLSFSVPRGIALPPSLINVYSELKADLGIDRGNNGCLEDWAKQGVLLLNVALTVEQGRPLSHQAIGWIKFTDFVIRQISKDKEGIVFLLWGRFAQQKQNLIDPNKHHILKAPHPSPLSAHRGFFGSHPFSQTNEILRKEDKNPINW